MVVLKVSPLQNKIWVKWKHGLFNPAIGGGECKKNSWNLHLANRFQLMNWSTTNFTQKTRLLWLGKNRFKWRGKLLPTKVHMHYDSHDLHILAVWMVNDGKPPQLYRVHGLSSLSLIFKMMHGYRLWPIISTLPEANPKKTNGSGCLVAGTLVNNGRSVCKTWMDWIP